jgi:hypothetical protein
MKKTNKENPITTFRKLNEARNRMVMKSLKKAQDGIGVNDTMNDDMINKAGSTGGYKAPAPVWYSQDRANILSELARPIDIIGTNVERVNNMDRGDYSNSAAKEARAKEFRSNALNDAFDNYKRQVGTQQQQAIQQEMLNKYNTTPKTGIPAEPKYKPNEDPNYLNRRQGKNGGIMKKGGTHKMPNGKVMLNSAMKKKTSKKK